LQKRFAWAFRFHQRFADQERFVTGGIADELSLRRIGCRFRYTNTRGGHFFHRAGMRVEIDFEGAQIAAVNADQSQPASRARVAVPVRHEPRTERRGCEIARSPASDTSSF